MKLVVSWAKESSGISELELSRTTSKIIQSDLHSTIYMSLFADSESNSECPVQTTRISTARSLRVRISRVNTVYS